MANIKTDLLQQVEQDRYFAEMDLIALVSNQTLSYKDKLEQIGEVIEKIALINSRKGIIEQYFQEAPQGEGEPQGDPQTEEAPEAGVPSAGEVKEEAAPVSAE